MDGVAYTQSGSYTNVYTNVNGCDSVHVLSLTINQSNSGSSSVTARMIIQGMSCIYSSVVIRSNYVNG